MDFHALLEDIQVMMQNRASSKNLSLHFTRASIVPRFVHSDPKMLRQILVNLVSNAIKFTEQGSITVEIDAIEVPRIHIPDTDQINDLQILVKVIDTGRGIPSDMIEAIFENFEQVKDDRSTAQGTGLGLTISREFAHLLRGNIYVESTINEGSTFYFHFLTKIGEADDSSVIIETRPVQKLAPQFKGTKILIVDDQETNIDILHRTLQPLGFDCEFARNGLEAIVRTKSWQPALILMDVVMPKMGGVEATITLKSEPDTKESKIIAISASAMEEEKQKILENGADGFLPKPFSEVQLLQMIKKTLKLEYIYDSDPAEDDLAQQLEDVDIQSISPEFREQIHYLATIGDKEELLNLLKETDSTPEKVHNYLLERIDRFDFEAICAIFHP